MELYGLIQVLTNNNKVNTCWDANSDLYIVLST